MAFDFARGLASLGQSVAQTAGVLAIEEQRSANTRQLQELANQLAMERESVGRRESHGFAKELQDDRFAVEKPEREARARSLDASARRDLTASGIAEREEGRKEATIRGLLGQGDGGTDGGGVNDNNIGNVRPVGKSTGFQQPKSFDEGVALAVNNARAYPKAYNDGKPMTLTQIGERWAPRGDGANDPVQWAKNVAAIGGLPVDRPIDLNDPEVAAKFARGVHGAEKGASKVRPLDDYRSGVTGQGGRGPLLSGGSDSGLNREERALAQSDPRAAVESARRREELRSQSEEKEKDRTLRREEHDKTIAAELRRVQKFAPLEGGMMGVVDVDGNLRLVTGPDGKPYAGFVDKEKQVALTQALTNLNKQAEALSRRFSTEMREARDRLKDQFRPEDKKRGEDYIANIKTEFDKRMEAIDGQQNRLIDELMGKAKVERGGPRRRTLDEIRYGAAVPGPY